MNETEAVAKLRDIQGSVPEDATFPQAVMHLEEVLGSFRKELFALSDTIDAVAVVVEAGGSIQEVRDALTKRGIELAEPEEGG